MTSARYESNTMQDSDGLMTTTQKISKPNTTRIPRLITLLHESSQESALLLAPRSLRYRIRLRFLPSTLDPPLPPPRAAALHLPCAAVQVLAGRCAAVVPARILLACFLLFDVRDPLIRPSISFPHSPCFPQILLFLLSTLQNSNTYLLTTTNTRLV